MSLTLQTATSAKARVRPRTACVARLAGSEADSQDAAAGAAAYRALAPHLAPGAWRTLPMPGFACPLDVMAHEPPRIPRLLAAYLALGAATCGPPAIDRGFRTIDFLTWIDAESPAIAALQSRGRFVG